MAIDDRCSSRHALWQRAGCGSDVLDELHNNDAKDLRVAIGRMKSEQSDLDGRKCHPKK